MLKYISLFKKEEKVMARRCEITGVGPMSGNKRSHSLRATRRVWNGNLQKYRININGKMVTVKMTARAHRSLMKNAK